jgi:flagellar biosynthesis protein FlhF
MQTKTYQAESMLEALQRVQTEMGPNAIVVSARDVKLTSGWGKGRKGVEVVAMSAGGQPEPVLQPGPGGGVTFKEERPEIEWEASPAPTPMPAIAPGKPAWQPRRISRAEIATLNQPVVPAPPRPLAHPSAELPQALADLQARLLSQGVDASMAAQAVNAVAAVSSEAGLSESQARERVAQQLAASLIVLKFPPTAVPTRVMALVGPSGSGKTSMVARLALFYRQTLGKQVAWINADTVRAGAIAEARSYADAIGLPMKLAYTPSDLTDSLAAESAADLVLVDLPGCSPYSETDLREQGALLAEVPDHNLYLVAAATSKEQDLLQSYAAFSLFGLKGLILTRLDETGSYGSVYSFARKCQAPLAFFSAGKANPGSIEKADAVRLVQAVLGKGWNR